MSENQLTPPPAEGAARSNRYILPAAKRLISGEGVVDPGSIIQQEINSLERWYVQVSKQVNLGLARYWAFKLPALILSVMVTVCQALGWSKANLVLGVLASLCVGIDAAVPGSLSFRTHRRAAGQIRRLQHYSRTTWNQSLLNSGASKNKLRSAAVEILKYIQEERARIDHSTIETELELRPQEKDGPTVSSE